MEEFGTPLSAQRMRAKISGEDDDDRGVIVSDGDSEIVFDDSIGSREEAAAGYEGVAAVMTMRAAQLRGKNPLLLTKPSVPPGWT